MDAEALAGLHRRFDRLENQLRAIHHTLRKAVTTMANGAEALADLAAAVSECDTVDQSVETLVTTLSAKIAQLGAGDTSGMVAASDVKALADELRTRTAQLQQAVLANTPSAPAPPPAAPADPPPASPPAAPADPAPPTQ